MPPCGWCRSWHGRRRGNSRACELPQRCWRPSGRRRRGSSMYCSPRSSPTWCCISVCRRARAASRSRPAPDNACTPSPDAAGALPPGAAIRDGGAQFVAASLPVQHIVTRLRGWASRRSCRAMPAAICATPRSITRSAARGTHPAAASASSTFPRRSAGPAAPTADASVAARSPGGGAGARRRAGHPRRVPAAPQPALPWTLTG